MPGCLLYQRTGTVKAIGLLAGKGVVFRANRWPPGARTRIAPEALRCTQPFAKRGDIGFFKTQPAHTGIQFQVHRVMVQARLPHIAFKASKIPNEKAPAPGCTRSITSNVTSSAFMTMMAGDARLTEFHAFVGIGHREAIHFMKLQQVGDFETAAIAERFHHRHQFHIRVPGCAGRHSGYA